MQKRFFVFILAVFLVISLSSCGSTKGGGGGGTGYFTVIVRNHSSVYVKTTINGSNTETFAPGYYVTYTNVGNGSLLRVYVYQNGAYRLLDVIGITSNRDLTVSDKNQERIELEIKPLSDLEAEILSKSPEMNVIDCIEE